MEKRTKKFTGSVIGLLGLFFVGNGMAGDREYDVFIDSDSQYWFSPGH